MSRELVESIAMQMKEQLLAYRHYLHENPELSFQEFNTSRFIKEKLQELNIPILEGITGTSILGELDSGIPGPTILIRADMDALPIQEENDWPHRSTVPGVMHACGHDIHTAILLCLAEAVSQNKGLMSRGKIRFAFQSGEEKTPGGAVALVRDGATNGVDHVFALHGGLHALGTIGLFKGPASMATGTYRLTVEGKGGHSAFPQKANDPIAALCDITAAIQRIVPSRIDPQQPSTVSVSFFLSGTENGHNIIPASGMIGGTVRCSNTENRDYIFDEIENIAKGICQQRRCRYSLEKEYGYPAMFNAAEEAEIVRAAALEVGLTVIDRQAMMGGEDFSYFQQACPGAFYTVGVCNSERPETLAGTHTSRFMPDEEGAINGFKVMMEICAQVLT